MKNIIVENDHNLFLSIKGRIVHHIACVESSLYILPAHQFNCFTRCKSNGNLEVSKRNTLDSSKEAQEVIFSRKATYISHSKLIFHNVSVSQVDPHKHLGLILDSELTFDIHIKTIMARENRTIGLTWKFQHALTGVSHFYSPRTNSSENHKFSNNLRGSRS